MRTSFKVINKQAKVNISVCSLKREIKVKVTKFCASLEELINVYKLTQFDSCTINGLWEIKLNATAKRNCCVWRRTDGRTDRRFSPIHRPDFLCNLVKNWRKLMVFELDLSCIRIKSYTKYQLNMSKHVGEKFGKLSRTEGQIDEDPDGRTYHTIIRPVWRRSYKNLRKLTTLQLDQ